MPVEDIKYLVGHEDITVTLSIYAHPGEESAERAASIVRAAKKM